MITPINGEKVCAFQIRLVFFQNPLQPLVILFRNAKIVFHQFPIGHNGDGKKLLPHLDARIPGTGGHLFRIGEYG